MFILGVYLRSTPFLWLQYGRKIASGSIGFSAPLRLRCVVFTLAAFRLHYILSSTSRMDALLNGLLVLSRLGRQKLTLKKLDMDRIMEDVLSNFEHEIPLLKKL